MVKLYVKYSQKKPYLPEFVADSKEELAKMMGVKVGTITSYYAKGVSTYKIVEIDENRRHD